ncbi:FtsX-like permease family protein [Clostridium sp. YIM B02505]|uniref:FtsX-like permease family protein n=1 Tax=Clostridium yunnanense TaxID=2800325 RepID=A0ABS1EQX2_9CLOT|nr:ABC transporter permease [Clostridium yunnanense]MBK1811759.1 FtsX-like permease family protein [Clostridium yunnanense]
MNLFNFSLKSMKSRWILFLFLYIQITLFVISSVNLYSMIFIKNITSSTLKHIVDPSKVVSINIDTAELMENTNKKFDEKLEFHNYIYKNPNVDKILRSYEADVKFNSPSKEFDEVFHKDSKKNNEHNDSVPIYSINKDYLDFLSSSISEGRTYNNEDYKNYDNFINEYIKNGATLSYEPTIPVIAGYSFKQFYKLNDTIEGFSTGKALKIKYKIIGFLKKDNMLLTNEFSYFTLNKKSLDTALIDYNPDTDFTKLASIKGSSKDSSQEKLATDITLEINNLVVILKNSNDQKTKNEIISKGKELNLFINAKSYDDDLSEFINEIKPRIMYETIKDAIILVFCLIGLLSSILALVTDKKQELGVLLSLGVNTRKLTLIYSLQYLLLSILSYLSGIVLSLKLNENFIVSGLSNTFTIYNILYPIFPLIVIFVVTSLLTNLTLKKSNPIDLIGGFRE